MDLLIVVAVVLVVAVVVSSPLRKRGELVEEAPERGDLADLEAAKEAKYGEIRDAELDWRTGKLSEEDWKAIDRGLRAEAVELLRRLDEVRDRAAAVR
jgi:hypothetical protein